MTCIQCGMWIEFGTIGYEYVQVRCDARNPAAQVMRLQCLPEQPHVPRDERVKSYSLLTLLGKSTIVGTGCIQPCDIEFLESRRFLGLPSSLASYGSMWNVTWSLIVVVTWFALARDGDKNWVQGFVSQSRDIRDQTIWPMSPDGLLKGTFEGTHRRGANGGLLYHKRAFSHENTPFNREECITWRSLPTL